MKVLFITYYWPPAGGVSPQRILHFVKNLSEAGVDCHVICPRNASYYQIDENLQSEIPADVSIHQVVIKDITSFIKKVPKLNQEGNIKTKSTGLLSRLAKWIRANVFIPDPKMNWVKAVTRKALELHKKHEFDLIFTNGTPHSVHLSGLAISEQITLPWIADFRDPWTKMDYFQQLPLSKSSLRKHQNLEKKVITKADVVLTVSENWRKDFIALGAKRAEVITNGFDEYIKKERNPNEFLISHIGSLHGDRSLDSLVKAVKRLLDKEDKQQIKLVLVGGISPETKTSILQFLPEDRVIMPGVVNHKEAKQWMAKSSILVLAINDSKASNGRIPAKLFEYLAAGSPIVCLGNDSGDAAELINKTLSGKCFKQESTEDISAYLNKVYSRNDLEKPKTDLIDEYSRKNKAMELKALMESIAYK